MDYTIIPQDNYHGEVTLGKNKRRVRCYSPEQMKKMHPNDDFSLAGETLSNNKAEKVAQLSVGGESFNISNSGSHNRLLYKVSGYVTVDGDTYVAILSSRLPFLAALGALAVGIVTAGAVTVGMLTAPAPVEEVEVVNPIPQLEPMAAPIEGDNKERVKSEKGGGHVTLSYKLNVNLNLTNGIIDIQYQNPGSSNHDVALELYVISGETEVMIARSGLIEPGYELNELTFIEGSAILSPGKYEGRYKAVYYDSETGERSMLESNLTDLKITVTE